MIGVNINKADPTDLYEQVAGELRRAIADGEAKPGDRLPPAKDPAAVLGVNTNTVQYELRGWSRNSDGKVVEGTFELGVEPSASGRLHRVTHRFFRPDGWYSPRPEACHLCGTLNGDRAGSGARLAADVW